MSIPIDNWQFWVTTGIFVVAVAWLFRGVLRRGVNWMIFGRQRIRGRRVPLTVGGRRPQKVEK